MVDLTSVRAPGWQRIVAELTAAAPDDRAFALRLLGILVQVSGARQGVLWAVDRGEGEDAAASLAEPRPVLVWPVPASDPPAIDEAGSVRAAAREAAAGGGLRIFGIEASRTYYGEESGGTILAVPLDSGEAELPGPRPVITLLLEPRSRPALQTTAAMVEVLAGYTRLHAVRQRLGRVRAASASLELAARLIAAINAARRFRGAVMALVNDLARHLRADRVALGWVHGPSGSVRVLAMSDTENVDRRMALVQKIEHAQDECADQEHAVVYPPPPAGPGGDDVLAHAIVRAHHELVATDVRRRVVSVPLREGDRVVGVITVETTQDQALEPAVVELLQAALDLVTPVLVVRRSDDRPLPVRAWASVREAAGWMVGPRHTGWKLVLLAGLLAAAAVVFVHVPYRVQAEAEVRPRTRYTVSVPFDGVIGSLGEGIEPGRVVARGEVLATMHTDELRLQRLHALAEQAEHEKAADAFRRAARTDPSRLVQAQQAEARAAQARARAELAELNLARAVITAPTDGVIIAGDLKDRVGAAVKLGEPLFQIAPLEDMLVIARVSDRDIALVRDEATGKPSRGYVAMRADPARPLPLTVERIVPLAEAREGTNTFEVRCRLDRTAPGLRPGMEGVAKLDTGPRSLLWIGTRRIRDELRLWLWW